MKIKKLLFGGGIALAMSLGLVSVFSAEPNDSVSANAYASASNVYINGTSFAANPYFKNGDTTTFTGTAGDYNAYYDALSGVLTLDGYIGERIRSVDAESMTITLVNDNVISATETNERLICLESNAYLTINGSGSLSIIATKTGASYYATGIYGHEGVNFEGEANVSIDMTGVTLCGVKGVEVGTSLYRGYSSVLTIDLLAHEEQNDCVYGIVADAGGMSFTSSGATTINLEDHNNHEDAAIFLNGLNHEVASNGSMTVGGGGAITLTMTGEDGFANGIVGDHNEENTTGKISFASGATTTITGFSRAIWNKSQARATAAADITISNNANVVISSAREGTCMGLVSERNGISVENAHLSVTTNDHPIHTAGYNGGLWISNESTFGFDVSGNSEVLLKSEYGVHTYSGATCDFNLTSGGYFREMKLDGSFPNLAGSFNIKLHPGTRLTNETHFSWGEYPTAEGGRQLSHYSGYDDDIIEFVAFQLPSSPNVDINGHVISGSKNYYVNDADDTKTDPSGYNAYYDTENAILYLKGYIGGIISFYGTNNGLFRVCVEDDSTITAATGFDVRGDVDIEFYSTKFSYLYVISTNASGNATCIDVADGSVTFTGNLNLRLTAEVTSTETGLARAIRVGYQHNSGSVYFDETVDAEINVLSNHEAAEQTAVMAYTNIVFNASSTEYRKLKFDTSSVVGGSYSIYAYGNIYFTSYKEVKLYWSNGESSHGPTYPTNKVQAITNGAYNIDETNQRAEILWGDAYHVEVLNGYTTNAASGNYINGATARFTANTIAGLTFTGWDHLAGTGEFVGETQTSQFGQLIVASNETVEATYDFVEETPFFDTKGSDYGSFRYKFKGSPSQVDVVRADDRSFVQTNITQTSSFSDAEVPDGNYRLRVHYGENRLFTDSFTVNHSAPAHDYNVTYHAGEGTGENVVRVTHGSYNLEDGSTMFTAPEGKRFYRWAIDSVGGLQYEIGQHFDIYFNKDFYAIYEDIPQYTMTYAAGSNVTGGSMVAQVKYEGENFVLPESTFEHPEHTAFDYWDVGGDHYNAGDTIVAGENLTATANYIVLPQYTLSFDHGDGTGTMSDVEKYSDESFTLPESTFTAPENFEFSHWEVGGVEKHPGDTIPATADIEAVAIFTRIQVTISFNAGEGSGTMAAVPHGKGTNYTLPECTFTAPAHKQFSAWLIDDTEYEVGDTYMVTGNLTITAVYEDIIRNITFSAGEGTGTMAGTTKVDGQSYVLPASTFTAPVHKEFKCWSIGGEEYQVGDPYVVNSDITIVAVFQDIAVNISVEVEGGSGSQIISGTDGGQVVLPECTLTAPEGKQFDGWIVDGVKHEAGESVTINVGSTIKAAWKDIPVEPETPTNPDTPATPDTPTTPTTPENPPKKGLSGGAIAGIVIASVVVVGVGGFALTWFVILKKTFADFLAIFKKK